MAKERTPEEIAAAEEKKKLQEQKRQLKKDKQQQKKEAKRRAKEIAKQEEALEEDEESNGVVTFLATVVIVALWVAVIGVVIKLDIGGFGSSVMTPLLKDIPVVNKVLPKGSFTETNDPDSYGGYNNLQAAVDQIKYLELELEKLQNSVAAKDEEITSQKAEIQRLSEFERMQVDFQRIRTEFYDEVVYQEKGPGAEAYRKYYEEMDPATAEYLYKQVVTQMQASQEIQDFVNTYGSTGMKPKQAAAVFEKMADNLPLVARILEEMSVEDRGAILGAMDSDIAAKLTKLMDPKS